MKKLYLKLFEMLREIPEIKYIDLNYGQLFESKPPLDYPAVLIGINIISSDDFHNVFQQINADFTLTIVDKHWDTDSLTEDERREQALSYLDLSEKIYRKLQGYEDAHFETFSRISVTEQPLRKGLRIIAERYSCGWKEDCATP
ncbi:hypothetical protein MWN41_08570 [Ornithobacterium rhinotracheale]|uniref:hypothetical protein n=1 Tax=Ornithobacterium rhinotracheale TaxID=28251 RepID=UPI001FF4BF3E|nr:hypothetical protein [Ornithobacterium rhinotracheale]MCK0203065.1 hypothetical protein [Ornithobacterium rhinotracheale]